MAASLFDLRLFMSTMRLLAAGLLSGLGKVLRPLGKVFTLFLLFVDDFLIVRYVSWVGHDSL